MTRQTAAILFSTLLLAGCNTLDFKEAEPERYAHLDCEALNLLAESYRDETQDQIFADVSDLERRNQGSRDLGHRGVYQSRAELDREVDRRSIALARREKGCV